MRLARASIRWRLTAWYSATLAATLVLFAIGSLIVLSRALSIRHDRHLDEARGAYVAELVVEYGELGTVRLAAQAAVRDTRFNETWVFVFDSSGTMLARGDAARDRGPAVPPLPAWATDTIAAFERGAREQSVFRTIGSDDSEFRIVAAPVLVGSERLVVAVAQSRNSVVETIEDVRTGYLVVIPLVLALSGIGGYWLARRALSPMAEMAARARTIGATNLDERLPAPDVRDEVGELAAVINDLLGRLERAFVLQRRFVADASHELRTPVTTVCAESDIVLGAPSRDEAEYRESLFVIRDAGRRLARIVEELFVLARIDAGHLPVAQEPLYVDELLADVARSLRATAVTRSLSVVVDAPTEMPFTGDPALLERMVLNLVDNALKYSPPGGSIDARVSRDDQMIEIVVADRGPGIPTEARERVFERFFRVDTARSRKDASSTGGAGLGLSIARWVAEAHGGTLVYRERGDGQPGSEFVARLPIRN